MNMLKSGLIFVLTAAVCAAGGENINSFTGRRERAEIFEFTDKPEARKQGEKYIITFTAKAECDATAAVVDKTTDSNKVTDILTNLIK